MGVRIGVEKTVMRTIDSLGVVKVKVKSSFGESWHWGRAGSIGVGANVLIGIANAAFFVTGERQDNVFQFRPTLPTQSLHGISGITIA